jgi:hypothetical protein
MSARNLPVPVAAEQQVALTRTRQKIGWVHDDYLGALDYKEPAVSGSLSFFTGGIGHMYNRKWATGAALFVTSMTALFALPAGFGVLAWAGIGAVSAGYSVRDTRRINRFVTAKRQHEREHGPDPSSYRLLSALSKRDPYAAMDGDRMQQSPGAQAIAQQPARAPGPFESVKNRLRQIKTLYEGGMINDVEYRDRKIDVFSGFSASTREELDALLYELMPLLEEGALTREDVDFLKQLSP